MSEDGVEHRLTTVEVKVLEHCSDIKNIRDDIHRLEDSLKIDIKSNHDLIVKILDNEIPHLQEEIKNGHRFGGNWDIVKLFGGIAGFLATTVLIIQNGALITQWLHNLLHIFFNI
jgi:hypothetical protein